MINKKNVVTGFVFIALVVLPLSLIAEEIRDYYAEPGLNPFKDASQYFNESIDPFSGTLQHKYVDLKVPGNGGMDITISRVYTSRQDSNTSGHRSYTGMGWSMHMGKIVVPTNDKDKICSQQIWSVHTQDNPSIEFPDGGRELLVLSNMHGDETLITKTNWKADCKSVTQGMRVTSPDGTIYYMDVAEYASEQYSWYASRIEDLDGNWININYKTSFATKYIDTITSSDGRTVTYEYKDLDSNAVRLWKVSANGQTVEYDYTPVVGGPLGAQHLTKVTRPDNLTWEYDYLPQMGVFDAGSHSLKSVTYPHGGSIDYTYQLVKFDPENTFSTTSIQTKNTSGGQNTDAGTWTYKFTPSTGMGIGDETRIDTPDGIEIYSHQGYNSGGSIVWPIGLLVQKLFYDKSGQLVEAVTNTWLPRIISQENYWHGRSKLDDETAAPVLDNVQHWKDGFALTTYYSEYDPFGNPGKVTEECSYVDCDDRVTNKTYDNDTAKWIIGQPLVDAIEGVGSITNTYYGNGRLKSIDNYGVLTSYEYTPEGNLSKETNARGYSKSYSNYFRGIAKTETSQVSETKNIQITRVVNPTGTVASITDGRQNTRSFTYDGLNRLKSIDFPVNDDVTISYGKGQQVLTRGIYQETSTLNGFGSTISAERKDISNDSTVTTTTEYDALGRAIFQSYPNSSLGVSTEYDALGRTEKVTKGDGTFKTIEHGQFLSSEGAYLGKVKITDENLNASYQSHHHYGSFNDGLGILNLVTDITFTTTRRGILGELKEVVQGRNEGDIIANSFKRSYGYDSHQFLVTIDNPETGVTTLGRDEIGNKISSQVGASPITTYDYDGVNRLKAIDYPDDTVDAQFHYDDNSNLLQGIKGGVSWLYNYDENDNLETEKLTIAGSENRVFDIGYLYNGLDNVSQVTYPNGEAVDFAPDAFGRAKQVGQYANSVVYHPNGVLDSLTYGNGVGIKNTLNDIQMLEATRATASSFGDVVDLQYNYDPVGNVKDTMDGVVPANNLTLGYDVNNRLINASGSWGTGTITYSSHGDINTKEIGSNNLAYWYSNRRLVQLDNLSNPAWNNRTQYQYDVYGNLASKSLIVWDSFGIVLQRDYNYNFDNASNLLSVDNVDTSHTDRSYQYDANNYRVLEEGQDYKRFNVYNKAGVLLYESDDIKCENNAYIYLGSTLIAKDVKDQPPESSCASGDAVPPVVTSPADLTVEATAVLTPVTLGAATAIDDVDGALTPTPDQAGPFGVGIHTITWSVTDSSGNTGTAIQTVTVQDTTPPVLTVPADVSVTAAVSATVDIGQATATDIFSVTINNDAPASYPAGSTLVTWTATDANGNSSTGTQNVTVTVLDSVPVVTPPAGITVEATALLTPVTLGTGTAIDDIDGTLTPTPDQTGPFGVGVHTITWSATDSDSNTGTATQTVTVQDTTPPVLTVPADVNVTAAAPATVDIGQATATDIFSVTITNDAPASYPAGTTAVTWTATDANGNVSTGTQNVIVTALSVCNSQSQIPESECEALLELWESTDGPNWWFNGISGWEERNTPPCNWLGVTCTGGHVTGLDLRSKHLVGPLPDMALPYLETLDLTDSQLNGEIPDFSNLPNLEVLALWRNQLTGEIPDFSNLPNLRILNLGDNQLSGEIPYFSNLTHLYNLDLSGNELSGEIPNFSLIELSTLHLSDNKLTGAIPDFDLPNLSSIQLMRNQLSGEIPDFNLPNLSYVLLINNHLSGEIPGFNNLPSLEYLYLRGNKLSGVIPDLPDTLLNGNFGYNALTGDLTGEGAVLEPDWADTQTIPPIGVTATQISSAEVEVSWTAVSYSADPGYYQVFYATTPGGPYTSGPATSDKNTTSLTVSNLTPSMDYYFIVKTTTLAHVNNQNDVTSVASVEVSTSSSPPGMPVVTPPADISVEATAIQTPVDLGEATAVDDIDGALTPTPDQTGPFDLGVHTITWSATDSDSNTGSATQTVTVQDTTEPVLTVPDDITVSSAVPIAVDIGTATATDIFPVTTTNNAPALFELGQTEVTWEATDANGNTTTAIQTVTVTATTGLELNVSRSLRSPQIEGAVYVFDADASGGSGSYEYLFEVKGPATGDVFQIVQDYSPTSSLSWNTTGFVGENKIRVSVRNAGTTDTPIHRTKNAYVNPASAVEGLTVTRNLKSPQVEGAVYVIDATATGGSGNYEYLFEVKGPATGDVFQIVQDYSPTSSLSWNTTGFVGDNKFRISVRNAGTTHAPVRKWIRAYVNPAGATSDLSVTRTPKSPQIEGTGYLFTAQGSGGSGDYEYRFELKSLTNGGGWVLLQDYSPTNSFNWDTTGHVGQNSVRISVRNAGSDHEPIMRWRRADVTAQ